MSASLDRLRKLAGVSSALRQASLQKEAGLFKSVGWLARKGIGAVGRSFMKSPLTTAVAGVGAYGAALAGKAAYERQQTGLDPEVHKNMIGSVPVPPGTT